MATIQITITIDEDIYNAIEDARGDVSRSKFISNILKKEVLNEQNT